MGLVNYITTSTRLETSRLLPRNVPKLEMYSLLFVETTNDMSFSLPETKYDKPF